MKSIKLLLVFFLFVFGTAISFAQDKREHVVAKGETLSSIASKYSVSEADLISENPILKNYIYVGMKIRIPEERNKNKDEERPKQQVETQSSPAVTNTQQNTTPVTSYSARTQEADSSHESESASYSKPSQGSRWGFSDKVGYYFVPKNGNSASTLMFLVGADFAIAKIFFVEGLLGYGYNYSIQGAWGSTVEQSNHYIIFSQHANLIFPIGNLFGAGIFTGPEQSFFLTGTKTQNKEKIRIKPDNRLFFSYSIGAKFYIGTFTIGAEYKIPLYKGADSALGFFIGYTFG